MTTEIRVFRFRLRELPDPSDRALAAACGGDVRGRAFAAAEQVLRMLATMPAGSVRAAIRLGFAPGPEPQSRLVVELAVAPAAGSEAVADRLLSAGPLAQVYALGRGNPDDGAGGGWPLPGGLAACCEVVRREDAWAPAAALQRANPHLRDLVYYALAPFEARDDNDWMALDRLLDRFDSPAAVEVVVEPADVAAERRAHHAYQVSLLRVNAYGDDLDPEAARFGHDAGAPELRKPRDPMADDVHREGEEVHRKLREPHLRFAVRCWAARPEEAALLGATVAEAALTGGRYRLLPFADGQPWWDEVRAASERLEVSDRPQAPEVWEREIVIEPFERLAHLATVDELKGLFRLPVGSPAAPPRTARRRTDPPPVAEGRKARSILVGDDLELGDPAPRDWGDDLEPVFSGSAPGPPELRLDVELLKKHLFIAGVPGSGKTTAMNNLVAQLAHLDPPVPFLVIEPAKTEYRLFKRLGAHPDPRVRQLAAELRVFTVGNEEISPFRFNPLWYPEGIGLDEHIGALLSCFEAAMPMGGPLQGLLAEAVEAVYEETPRERGFPRLKDLLAAARRIVETKGYEGEVLGNLRAALDVRLGLLVRRNLGRVFDCEVGVPHPDELFGANVILEMDYLTPEHACLMSLFVLTAMREHVRVGRVSGSSLEHVTFIEEAHNIVGRSGDARASEEAADPKAFAAQYVSRMLAEMRALGEGMVIADQLPSAVAPEVVKNTGTKLAHRLVANQDREDLGGTMLLDAAGIEELARLRPGEAYLYSEGLYRPRRVRALGSHEYLALGQSKTDARGRPELPQPPGRREIGELLGRDGWFVAARCARAEAALGDVERLAEAFAAAVDAAKGRLSGAQEAIVALRGGGVPGGEASLVAETAGLADGLAIRGRTLRLELERLEALGDDLGGGEPLERLAGLRRRLRRALPGSERCIENLRRAAAELHRLGA